MVIPPDGTPLASLFQPRQLFHAMSAAGVSWSDLSSASTATQDGDWHEAMLTYLSARACAAQQAGVDPLLYVGGFENAVGNVLARKQPWDTFFKLLWPAVSQNSPLKVPSVIASRHDLERVAPDMLARAQTPVQPLPLVGQLSEDGLMIANIPSSPTLSVEVNSMADLIRALSFRQRTLERFRAPLEPHHWGIPLNTLLAYSKAIDSKSSLTPLGIGLAIQPDVPVGTGLFEDCRPPPADRSAHIGSGLKYDTPNASSPLVHIGADKESDSVCREAHAQLVDSADLPVLQLLHNPLPTPLHEVDVPLPGPLDLIEKYSLRNICSVYRGGRFVHATECPLWCGLMAFVRANFEQGPQGASGLKRHRVPFPVRVLVTVLPPSRLADPVMSHPTLSWDQSWQFSGAGVRRESRISHIEMRQLSRSPTAAAFVGRALLSQWQSRLFVAWKHALPDHNCVVAIAPESIAEVKAAQQVATTALRRGLRVTQQLSGVTLGMTGPAGVYDTSIELVDASSGAAVSLPAGLSPAASPHADDPLTLLGDALAAGPPQPYRPPVSTVAREILKVFRNSTDEESDSDSDSD